MFQNSIVVSLITNIYISLSSAWRRCCEGSSAAALLRAVMSFLHKLSRGSSILRFCAREGYFEKNWSHSITAGALTAILNAPAKLLNPALGKMEKALNSSLSFKVFSFILDNLHIWMGLYLAAAIAVPHSGWSNTYSTAAAVVFLILYCSRTIVRYEAKPLLLALNSFQVLFMVSVLFAALTSVSFSSSLRFLIFYITGFLFFAVLALSIDTKRQLSQVIGLLLIGLLMSGLYGVWQGIVGVPVNPSQVDITLNAGSKGRIWSTFDNPNNFAEVIVLLVPFYLSMALNSKKVPAKLFWIALSAPAIASLILTKSRADWLGFAVAVVVFVYFKNKKLLPIVIVLGALSVPFLPSSLVNRAMSIFNLEDSSNKTRIQIYQTIWPMLKDYWVTGFGLGTDIFRKLLQAYPLHSKMIPAHSHNLFIQIWMEAGIAGFITFVGFLAGLFKKMVKAITQPKDKFLGNVILAGLCGLAAICVASLADHIWFNPRVMLLFWSVAGIVTAALIMLRQEDKQAQWN